jgi:hypothetical protein
MKIIKIQISDYSDISSTISYLDGQISQQTRNSPEFTSFYPQLIECIEDFAMKARKLSNAGTTIHIQKEFTLSDTRIFITLDYPMKSGFLSKLTRFLKRD